MVYRVINGQMRSAPLEAAIRIASDFLESQAQQVEALRQDFQKQYPIHPTQVATRRRNQLRPLGSRQSNTKNTDS